MPSPVFFAYFRRALLAFVFVAIGMALYLGGETHAATMTVHLLVLSTTTYLMGERAAGTSGDHSSYMGMLVWVVYLCVLCFVLVTSMMLSVDKPYLGLCYLSVYTCSTAYAGGKVALVTLLVERLRILRDASRDAPLSRWKDRHWLAMMGLMVPYLGCGSILLANIHANISKTNTCFLNIQQISTISMLSWNTFASLVIGFSFVWETVKLQRFRDGSKSLRVSLRGVHPAGAVVACLIYITFSCANIISLIYNEHQHYRTCLTLCVCDKWFGMFVTDYMSGLVADMEKVRTDAEEAMDAIAVMELDRLEHLEREPTSRVQASLARIIGLLRDIKQFIPSTYLASLKADSEDVIEDDAYNVTLTRTDAPGTVSGRAAIVFTDIVSSTQLWEACPEGMAKGMRLHNKTVRDCIAEMNGYEVKTIGDAFMVSFDTSHEAVSFGVLVQERMYGLTWPQELVDFSLAPKEEKESKVGMQLRIGVNAGDTRVEFNGITGRADYFGPTVNVAARIESRCVAGSVAAPQAVYDEWKTACGDSGLSVAMGDIELKGVGQKVSLVCVIPSSMPWREKAVKALLRRPSLTGKLDPKRSMCSTRSSAHTATRVHERKQDFEGKLATVARIELRFTETSGDPIGSLNEKLGKVIGSLERTEGSITALFGSHVIAGWNTSRRNMNHVQSSFVFCQMLHKSTMWAYSDGPVFVGLCTGTVYAATLGAAGQRFMTSIGACLGMAGHVLHRSINHRVFALYCTLLDTPVTYSASTRPVLRWDVKRIRGTATADVHEVCLETNDFEEELEWGWTQDYWTAFAEGNEKQIREKCESNTCLMDMLNTVCDTSVFLYC